jgi:hypothetical protein
VATTPVPAIPIPPVVLPPQPSIQDPNAALLAAQQRAALLGLAVPGSLSAAAAAGAAAGAALKAAQPGKAPVLRLDHLGREVDEEGNVVEQKKLPPSELKVRRPILSSECVCPTGLGSKLVVSAEGLEAGLGWVASRSGFHIIVLLHQR